MLDEASADPLESLVRPRRALGPAHGGVCGRRGRRVSGRLLADFVPGLQHKRQVDKSLENRQPKLPDVEVGIPPRNTQGSNVQTVANMKSPLAKDDTCSGQVVHQAERYATVMKPKHPRQGGNCLDAALNM